MFCRSAIARRPRTKAVKIANAIADAYIVGALEAKYQSTKRATRMAPAAQHRAERAGNGQRSRRANLQGRAQHRRNQPRPDVRAATVGPEYATGSGAGGNGRSQGSPRPDRRDLSDQDRRAIDRDRRAQQLGHHPPARPISRSCRPNMPIGRGVMAKPILRPSTWPTRWKNCARISRTSCIGLGTPIAATMRSQRAGRHLSTRT